LAADEGGGKPRDDAALPAEGGSEGTDDLDALAGGLGSIAPADGHEAGGDDEVPDLSALGAMTARTTLTDADSESAQLENKLASGAQSSEAVRDALRPAILTSSPPRARAAWVMPLLVGIGVGVGIAGVLFGLSKRPDPPAAAAAATPAATNTPAAVPAGQAAAAAPAAEPAAAPTPAPAPAAEPTAVAATDIATATATATGAPRVAGSGARSAAVRADAHPQAASAAPAAPVIAVHPAAEAPAADGDPDVGATIGASEPKAAKTMDALLDEALSPKARRDELAARQQAALDPQAPPPTPSRADVTQAVAVLLPAIRGCAMGQSGLATAGIVVNSDGRVASVDVAGAPFAGTASGRCMEGVLRRARFPRFTQPSFRIKYPLAIQ
jgi:hypothetical protein